MRIQSRGVMIGKKRLQTKFAVSAVIAGSVLLSTNATYASSIVFAQPSVFPGPYFSWGSDREPSGFGFQVWDDFSLPNPTFIDGITWQGLSLDQSDPANNPTLPDATSWEISFWSNDGDQPFVPLQSETIPVEDVQSDFVGLTSFCCSQGEIVTAGLFEFRAVLTAPFTAQGGNTYWLSTLSNSPTYEPHFSWFMGEGGDGITVQEFLGTGTRITRPGDRAFTLEGRVVPEPLTILGSLTALGVGAALKKEHSKRLKKKAKSKVV